jgi:hypothetical protein
VQGFFARLLESDGLAVADRTRGRFRSSLLAAFGHFLAADVFAALKPALGGDRGTSCADLAREIGTTQGAIMGDMHRLRARCGEMIRDEVAQSDP